MRLSLCETRVKLQVKLFFSPTPPSLGAGFQSWTTRSSGEPWTSAELYSGSRYTPAGRRTVGWLWENVNIFTQIVQVLVLFHHKKSSETKVLHPQFGCFKSCLCSPLTETTWRLLTTQRGSDLMNRPLGPTEEVLSPISWAPPGTKHWVSWLIWSSCAWAERPLT